jgi:adenylate kinase
VAAIMARGALVSDEILQRVLLDQLPEGFVLDGYPRTAAQAQALDRALTRRALDGVLELVVPEEVLLPRLLSRATEQGRTDDTPETIAARLELYRQEIAGMRRHYGTRLTRVDGLGSEDEVFARLASAADGPRS